MLTVAFKYIVLWVSDQCAKCRYAECHYADSRGAIIFLYLTIVSGNNDM
jgi:hypothetical protein